MAKLLPHLKKLSMNIDAGKDLKGNILSTKKRKETGKLLGAGFFRSVKGKIKKV